MESIWMALSPGKTCTRVLVMQAPNQLLLKAQLSLCPSSPRAVPSLLEAIALWEGVKVRAALVVDEDSTHGATSLYRDTFAVFGEQSALYSLQWVPRACPRKRDELRGMGEFGDLERIVIGNLAR